MASDNLNRGNLGPSPLFVVVTGAVIGALTLVFLMALVIMASLGYPVPPDSHFLILLVLSLGAALASSFLGGSAAARGSIPLPLAKTHPLQFSIAGGVGVLVI